MTLNLFDGAIVLLRNGERVVISANKSDCHFPWCAEGTVPRRTWTKEGRYQFGEHPDDHQHDIIGLADEVDVDDGSHSQSFSKIDATPFFIVPKRTETKRRVFMREDGITLDLFDGAHVMLRNGTKAVLIRDDQDRKYVWSDESGLISWDEYGCEIDPSQESSFDIMSVFVEVQAADLSKACTCPPDERPAECQHKYALRDCWLESAKTGADDLFDAIPYLNFVGFQTMYGPAKYKARNGRVFTGLTFLQDEFFTSQRDYIWDRKTGECIGAVMDIVDQDDTQFDIVTVLVPKAPAELAKPAVTAKEFKDSVTIFWDAPKDPDLKETRVFLSKSPPCESFSRPLQRALYEDFRPTKALHKMIKQMAKAVGGKLDKWRWITSSEIEITVRFKSKLRNVVEPSEYLKTIRLTASGCDNNAVLPMRPRK